MTGSITIDGNRYTFTEGATILDIALKNGVKIPVLCYLKDIAETGACRICLVEVEGIPVPVASCATFASDGMVVRTDTENVKKHRRSALEFILLKHPLECPDCENSGDCHLQDIAKAMGVSEVKNVIPTPKGTLDDWDMYLYNRSSCVLCQRCAKVCNEVTGCNALEITSRGKETHMTPSGDDGLDCDYCGICADVCPVGAIIEKPFRYSVKVWQLSNVHTSCAFCPVGCRINYGVYGGNIHRVRRSGDGYTCSKGRYGFKYIESRKRLKTPIIKRNGVFVKTSWGEAVESIRDAILKYGQENSIIVAGSRLTNEEVYNFKSLSIKTGMRFISEAEFHFGSFMRKFRDKFGHFESYGTMAEIETSDLIFVIGADFARECVGLKWRVLKGAMKNNAKIITIGLQRYEYDEHTYASIIADYGNFALEFEKIKSDESQIYTSIRKYIETAGKVCLIVGNEYFGSEEQEESVLSFADFIGEDKLRVFIPANDKVNYIGALYAEGERVEDVMANKPKVVFAMAVNPGKGKLEALGQIINEAEFYATPDLFITGQVKNATVVMPVQASIEGDGTYLALDGRLNRMRQVVEPPVGTKSNSEIAQMLATLFHKKIDADHTSLFTRHADDFGFALEDLDSDKDVYKSKVKQFLPTEYRYHHVEHKQKTVYVNPRHHEGVLTRMLECEDDLGLPLFPDVEVVVKPGVSRSHIDEENIAKGVTLLPRG